MPNDPGADSFASAQYAKMLDALSKLDDPNKGRALRDFRGVTVDAGKSPQINIPNWDGIIRVGPRPTVTSEDWNTQRAFERAGQPSPLSAEIQAEIARRRDFARNIPNSATPEYMGGISQFVNATDNVQDFAATIAIGGRLALAGVAFALDRLAPGAIAAIAAEAGAAAARAAGIAAADAFAPALLEAAALAESGSARALASLAETQAARTAAIAAAQRAAFGAAERAALLGLGSRIAARFLPVIGWTLLAADILNLLTQLAVRLGPFYALACGGPRDALAAAAIPFMTAGIFRGLGRIFPRRVGVPALRADKGNKATFGRAAARMPGGRTGRGASSSRYGALSFSFAEAITAAQVGADMVGYGVSLGGIVGATSDTAFSTARGGAPSMAGRRSPRVNHEYRDLIAPRLAGLSDGALWHRQLAARTLATAPLILANPELAGDENYVLAWIAVYCAQEVISWEQQGLDWRAVVASATDAHWFGWPVRDEGSRDTVKHFGHDPDALSPWPLPGLPLEITPQHYLEQLAPAISRGLIEWCNKDPNDPLRAFVAELSGATAERFWTWLEDSPHYPTWRLSADSCLLESLLRANVWPVISDDETRLVTAWQEARQKITDEDRGWLTRDELEAIWDRHEVPLLRLLAPDADLSPVWFLPFDQATGQPTIQVSGTTLGEARDHWRELEQQQPPP